MTWRAILILPTLVAASIVVFAIMRALPGDVVLVILSGSGEAAVSPKARDALEEELGLKDPLPIQYARWLGSMMSGGFGGRSLTNREAIGSIIARQLPITLLLTSYTVLLSILISQPLGILAAVWNNRWPDYLIRIVTLGGLALPNLWIAILVILILLHIIQWSPPIIYASPWSSLPTHFQMMILPTLILVWEYSSHLVRVTRSSMLSALGRPYITTARAKGIPEHFVILRHAVRNALIPSVTMLGLQYGNLIGGTLILETIFGLPGIGRGLVQATLNRDYPVVQTLVMLMVLLSLLVNFVVDTLYTLIDPRMSHTINRIGL